MKNIGELASRLHEFAAVREWEQFHTPKNLAMALAGEVASCSPSCSGSPPRRPARS
jgi:hypothetical protein